MKTFFTRVKVGEAAKTLGVSIDTVRRWTSSGKLPSIRSPGGTRFYEISELEKLAPRRQAQPEPDAFFVPQKPTILIRGSEALPKKGGWSWRRVAAAAALAALAFFLTTGATVFLAGRGLEPKPTSDVIGESQVLAVATGSAYLEINSDVQFNGSVNLSSTNNSFTVGTNADTNFLTVVGGVTLDQNLSQASSPTFANLTLAAGTIVFTGATQTLTNKTMSGSSNTFSNIPNSALSNSKVTVTAGTNLSGGGDVSLGSSVTINLKGDLSITSATLSGNLGVVGLATVSGMLTTGGNLMPLVNGVQDIGSSSLVWNNIYANNVIAGSSGTSGFWQRNTGALAPTNITDDVLIGAAATGSAKIVLSGTSGRIGVGVTSPGYTVDVTGTVNITGSGFTGLRMPTGSSNNYVLTTDGAGNASWTNPSGMPTFGAWTLSGSTIYANLTSYKVLLGSTDVTDSTATFRALANSGTTPVASISGATSFASLVVDNSGVGDLFTASSSGLNRFVITQNGNVGIGMTSPQRALSVSGDTVLDGNLVSRQDDGAYLGRTRLTAPQLAINNAGTTWQVRDSSRAWFAVAVSSDGKYQTATVNSGNIYISSDYGNTWTAKDSSRAWRGVAMSSDGKYQTAGVDSGNIYISSDYGNTWTAKDSARLWRPMGMSSDGKYQTTAVYLGNIYISSDYGNTWTAKDSARGWYGVAVSSDGRYQTAVVDGIGDNIYISSDYGNTWTAKDSARSWDAVAMSSDGKYQTAVADGIPQQIRISSDYGNTWTAKNGADFYLSAAMSADGKYQIAGVSSGTVYLSSDYGSTWSAVAVLDNGVSGLAMSSDGKVQTAVTQGGHIYVSYADSYVSGLAGNVGIGTTSPIALLQILGSSTTQVASVSASTGKAALLVDNTIGDLFTASSSGMSRFVITQNGNVGIGTTNPSSFLLQVDNGHIGPTTDNESDLGSSTLRFRNLYAYNINTPIAQTGQSGYWQRASGVLAPNSLTDSLIVGLAATPSGAITTGSMQIYGINNLNPVASISAVSATAAFVVDNRVGDLFTASSSGLNRFVITQNGNVGVGTTTPAFQLQVSKTVTGVNDLVAVEYGGSTNDAGGYAFRSLSTEVGAIRQQRIGAGSYNLQFLNWSGSALAEDMTILSSGNVGINATIPREKLDVGGNIALSFTDGVRMGMQFGDGSAYRNGLSFDATNRGTNVDSFSGDSTSYISFRTGTVASPQERMRIVYGGSIGIGATVPLATLDVRGNSGITPVASISGQTSFAAMVVDNKGVGDIFTASSSGLNRFVITQNGNVGIGTTVPATRLYVLGSSTTGGGLTIRESGDQYGGEIYGTSSFPINGGLVIKGRGNGGSGVAILSDSGRQLSLFPGRSSIPAFVPTQQASIYMVAADTSTDILRWTDSSGTTLGAINASGSVGVGVGTASLLGTLDVRGNSGITPVASISGQTSFAAMVVDNKGVGDIFTASSSGLNRFVITQNGNIGVGSTVPGYGLDVNKLTAAFNSGQDGSLGSWSTNSNALPATLYGHGAAVAGGYMYIIGGYNGTGTVATVYYAKINANGSVDKWVTGTSLPANRYDINQEVVVANGYIYVVGGDPNATGVGTSTVYYAKINADGSVGSWQTSPNALSANRRSHSVLVANGYIYAIGGNDGASNVNTVLYARLNPDGTTGSWLTNSNNLPASIPNFAAVVANGWMYVMGGVTDLTTVYYAKINTDGSVGNFSTTTVLPAGRQQLGGAAANGYLYAIAGSNAGVGTTTVYYARLNGDGTIGSWSTNSNALPANRKLIPMVVANGYVYVPGGLNQDAGAAQSTVYYASTARVSMAADLDLLGLTGQQLSSASAGVGGSIYAGNIFSNADLQVVGNTQLWNGLSVLGGISSQGQLAVAGNLGTMPVATISGQTSFAAMVVDNKGVGDIFTASSSGLNRFVITQNGNVGIGTTVPNFPLDVVTPTNTVGLTVGQYSGSSSNGDLTSIGFRLRNTLGGSMYGTPANYDALVGAYVDGASANQSGLAFYTRPDSTVVSERMRIDHSGNVGIGATSPLATLDIRGNSGIRPVASISGQTSFAAMVVDNKGVGDIFTASSSGLNRFVITQNGNVGIGTTIPTSRLQIKGVGADGLTLERSSASQQTFIKFTNEVVSELWRIYVPGAGTQNLVFEPINNTINAIFVPSGGNFGIGTTSPLATFDVRGSSGITPVASISGQTSFAAMVVDNKGVGDIFTASSSGLNRFVITQNGFVGIGTATPVNVPLTLNNSNSNTVIAYQVGGTSKAYIGVSTGTNSIINFDTSGDTVFRSENKNMLFSADAGGNAHVVVNNNGYVGIGLTNLSTVTARARLDVVDSTTSTSSAFIENSNTASAITGLTIKLGSTTNDNTSHYINFLDLNGKIIGDIRGNAGTGVQYQGNGIADFGEYMRASGGVKPDAGTIVCQAEDGVVPCEASQSAHMVGVVSNTTAFLGGEQTPESVIVGFVGQIRVKAHNVRSGDLVAVDPQNPGYGISTTSRGYIVGVAAADQGSDGTVVVKVHPSWSEGESYLASGEKWSLDKLQEQVMGATNINLATLSAELATISGNLMVLGRTQLAETSIGGSLTVGMLHFDDVKAEISALTGQVTVAGDLKVTGKIAGTEAIRGELVLEPGQTATSSAQSWGTAPRSVVVTPNFKTAFWVSDVSASGFTVHTDSLPVASEEGRIFWQAMW